MLPGGTQGGTGSTQTGFEAALVATHSGLDYCAGQLHVFLRKPVLVDVRPMSLLPRGKAVPSTKQQKKNTFHFFLTFALA